MPPQPVQNPIRSAVATARAVAALLAASLLAALGTVIAAPRHASASGVLVPGSDWAGAVASRGDVSVYAGRTCTDVAERWMQYAYGEQNPWNIGPASDMWNRAPHLSQPLVDLPNGGSMPPQFGDLLLFAPRGDASSAGHVAVVSGVGPGVVDIVEQNWSPSGRATLPIHGTDMPPRGGSAIIGWIRSPTTMPQPQPRQGGPAHQGYWELGGDGGIFPFGEASGLGSTGGMRLNSPVVGMAALHDGSGYWLVAGDGGIFPFGRAGGLGSLGGTHLNQPIVGMAATPTGRGYWLVASDGGIFPFGDAGGYGSTGGIHLNQPIVGMAVTPAGRGYWLVASDGGIFPFGDAHGYGSTGGTHLNRSIVGMAAAAGGGYWLVAADGGIFAFGPGAGPYGSLGSSQVGADVDAITATRDGRGYWLTTLDGGVYGFGDAEADSSTRGTELNAPVVAMTGV